MANKLFVAAQVYKALQLFAATLTDESTMMMIPDVYPSFKLDYQYKTGNVFKYGENEYNETQLYQVLQDHTSAEQWMPDSAPSLYKKIGVTPEGYNIWTQPLGSADAYSKGDIVKHNEKIWVSDVDGNVWEPGVYGWTEQA